MANNVSFSCVQHNVRRLRQQRGWSQEQLSRKSKISRSYIGHLEARGKNVTLATIYALAEALQVDPRDLLRPIEEWPHSNPPKK